MGMYDTIIIEHHDITYELQTKRFYGVLNTYRIGDVINGIHTGEHCYFYPLYLKQSGEIDWHEVEWETRYHVFITIANGIYCDYQVKSWISDNLKIQSIIGAQKAFWKDAQRVLDVVIESVKRYQHATTFYLEQREQILRLLEFAEQGEQRDKLGLGIPIEKDIRQSIREGRLFDEIRSELDKEPHYQSYVNTLDELQNFRL